MSDFKKGQLVAVNCPAEDDRQWHLRIFKEQRPDGHFVAEDDKGEDWAWQLCLPAEHVWPDVFLGHDRDIIDSCQRSLNWEERKSKERWNIIERMSKRMSWLCEQLQAIGDRNGVQECPPSPHQDCRRGNCADCWAQASLEAVMEDANVEL